jgi:hypothetical protein
MPADRVSGVGRNANGRPQGVNQEPSEAVTASANFGGVREST